MTAHVIYVCHTTLAHVIILFIDMLTQDTYTCTCVYMYCLYIHFLSNSIMF